MIPDNRHDPDWLHRPATWVELQCPFCHEFVQHECELEGEYDPNARREAQEP